MCMRYQQALFVATLLLALVGALASLTVRF